MYLRMNNMMSENVHNVTNNRENELIAFRTKNKNFIKFLFITSYALLIIKHFRTKLRADDIYVFPESLTIKL